MTDAAAGGAPTDRPDDRAPSVLRVASQLVAWVATPWALGPHSWLLATASVMVLIGLPTLFSTPGDTGDVIGDVIIEVSGPITILLLLLELAAAVVSSWLAWPLWAAGLAALLVAATVVTERPRWKRLMAMESAAHPCP